MLCLWDCSRYSKDYDRKGCNYYCNLFEVTSCGRHDSAPYVCNGCPAVGNCSKTHRFYSAEKAQQRYSEILVSSHSYRACKKQSRETRVSLLPVLFLELSSIDLEDEDSLLEESHDLVQSISTLLISFVILLQHNAFLKAILIKIQLSTHPNHFKHLLTIFISIKLKCTSYFNHFIIFFF